MTNYEKIMQFDIDKMSKLLEKVSQECEKIDREEILRGLQEVAPVQENIVKWRTVKDGN